MRDTALSINKFRKLKVQEIRVTEDIIFLKRCRSNKIFPKFIKMKASVSNSRSEKAIHRAKNMWLNNELRFKYGQLSNIGLNLYSSYRRITREVESICADLWSSQIEEINTTCDRIRNEKKYNLNRKFKSLMSEQGSVAVNEVVEKKPNFVMNLSKASFNDEELNLINKGLKYKMVPNWPPLQEMVVNIESSLAWMDIGKTEKDSIRHDCKKVFEEMNLVSRHGKHDKNEQKLMREIRKKDVYLMSPDKGKGVVILDKEEYDSRMLKTIHEGPYEILRVDGRWKDCSPKHKMESEVLGLLKLLKSENGLKDSISRMLTVSNPKVPVMYGLPKIHKTGDKMRPIVSNIKTPTSKIAKWIVGRFNSLNYPRGLCVKNSIELVEKLKNERVEEDELLVSFDVVGLFPNVDLLTAYRSMESFLNSSGVDANEKVILEKMVKICMQQNTFEFRGKFYKQTSGVSIGNSASPMVADFFMNQFEEEVKNEAWFPKLWYRYVDDILAKVKKKDVDTILCNLNSIYPTIKFTMEKEENSSIPFLDLMIRRNENKLEFSIYRKPTDKQLFIGADSFHHRSHQHAAFHSMLHRFFNIPMSKESLEEEWKFIMDTARINGYKEEEIDKIFDKHERKYLRRQHTSLSSQREDPGELKFIGIPFHGILTEKLSRKFKQHGIKTAYQNRGKLSDYLQSAKDRELDDKKKSGIYKLNCQDCDKIYIGQTRREIRTRFNEHVADCSKPLNPDSAMAFHCLTENHRIKDVELLKEVNEKYKLDAWESLLLCKNRDKQLTNVIKLGNAPSILHEFCQSETA